jgi:predicted nucleic acid-binding protein
MRFIDSNIWLYGIIETEDEARHEAVESFFAGVERPVVSTQVINEVCSNAIRKAAYTHDQVAELIASFDEDCLVVPITLASMTTANELRARYSLSFWDSQIVACALLAGCTVLNSEDMQHGLVIENTLTVQNPFTSKS